MSGPKSSTMGNASGRHCAQMRESAMVSSPNHDVSQSCRGLGGCSRPASSWRQYLPTLVNILSKMIRMGVLY
ncbi:hypothetical protein VTN96DRAFT_7429 [Rasamsonia emersonii]